jgi:hypothetical protein
MTDDYTTKPMFWTYRDLIASLGRSRAQDSHPWDFQNWDSHGWEYLYSGLYARIHRA